VTLIIHAAHFRQTRRKKSTFADFIDLRLIRYQHESVPGWGALQVLGTGVLPAALSVGLTALGWSCMNGAPSYLATPVVAVVISHSAANYHDLIAGRAARRVPIVVVGSVRDPEPLIAAVRDGATDVIDADLPYAELLDAVAHALTVAPGADGWTERREYLLDALVRRQRERLLLGRLTLREQQVLRALAAGRVAADIAIAEHLGLATIRSHIKSVLGKLEVSSQLAAVAIARRNWREPDLLDLWP
jgi:DNA-binding NarL/FixJ family response regulator